MQISIAHFMEFMVSKEFTFLLRLL